ncbi:thioredoxin family protein [Pontibacter brevis]
MAVHSNTQLELGSKASNFALLDTVSDALVSLTDVASPKATVIMFISNHCPYVQHILETLVEVAAEYKAKGVNFVAISSNDAMTYPQDGPQQMKALALDYDFSFPYLYDQTQQVARVYEAECTPEFFVYDGKMCLAYHGQFDDSRPNNGKPVTGRDLRTALDALLAKQPVPQEQKPSIGCSIKWRES